ncbi:hypothetical protein HYW76_01625 [Candidatus Pacearchaeota archaeon]|nr:hypothetical protein [Candidatus Pacearchaeota archaeon]
MKPEEIGMLKQLIESIEAVSIELEEGFREKDLLKFKKAKGEILNFQKKIGEIISNGA